MNLDNKNGICCNCPALMDYSRDITQWKSAKIHDIEMMKKLNITNSLDYKNVLQEHGEHIIRNTIDEYNKKYRCINGKDFYLDTSNFHQFFDNKDNIREHREIIPINNILLNYIPE
jgi:hypothetical protein